MKKLTSIGHRLLLEMVRNVPLLLENSGSHVYLKSSNPECVYFIAADVIELSSGDEDALQISSESADEDSVGGSEESSGAHINDALNLPDALGQVLININHPAEENDIYLAPQLARAVKPHQVSIFFI